MQEVPSQPSSEFPTPEELAKGSTSDPSAEQLSPDQKMSNTLKDYPYLSWQNGILRVTHPELTDFLKPVIVKTGNLVKRGTILANLNGGVQNIDPQTKDLNACIATVMVSYGDTLKKNLLELEDTDLIIGLYVAAVSYNVFFRKTPLSFNL